MRLDNELIRCIATSDLLLTADISALLLLQGFKENSHGVPNLYSVPPQEETEVCNEEVEPSIKEESLLNLSNVRHDHHNEEHGRVETTNERDSTRKEGVKKSTQQRSSAYTCFHCGLYTT